VVGRVTECAFLFKSLAIASTETELKKSLVEAAGVSQEAAILIAESIPMERYDGIINAAHYSVAQILKHHYRREFVFLLWSCKSLNEVNGIDQAVQELTF
jgi:hypothetical protein